MKAAGKGLEKSLAVIFGQKGKESMGETKKSEIEVINEKMNKID